MRQTTRRYRRDKANFFADGQRLDAAGDPAADCWLCKRRIDYAAKPGTTDQSHELDHYYPVSLYPDLQHDPAGWRHSTGYATASAATANPRATSARPSPTGGFEIE